MLPANKKAFVIAYCALWFSLSGAMEQARCQPPPRPVPPSASNFPGGPATPMGRKLQEIIVLRALLTMRLSSADINAILPLLRDLQNAEQTLQMRAEQALNEERRALLTARPDAPLPPDSSEPMRQEIARYRDRQERLWAEAVKRIGEARAEGLRRIVGGPRPPQVGGPPAPGTEIPGPPKPPDADAGPPDPKREGPGGKTQRPRPELEPHLPLTDLIALLEQRRQMMPR